MNDDLYTKIKMHDAFWKREPVSRPLLSFRYGDRFPYDKMKASRALMQHGKMITPDMVDVDAFCEQTAEEITYAAARSAADGGGGGVMGATGVMGAGGAGSTTSSIGGVGGVAGGGVGGGAGGVAARRSYNDTIRGVSPFGGIPWMECLLGCGVMALEHSFISTPCQQTPGDPDKIRVDDAWLDKYTEFLVKYSERFGSSRPVVESLMRGCLDTYGAIIGQEEMIYAFVDEPGIVAQMLDRINRVHVDIINLTLSYSAKFEGGMLHPYGLWAPGTVNHFQEDLCALVTPKQMNDFVVPIHNRMCAQFDYNSVHTHPTSYHAMQEQLSVEGLQLVQVQKDEGDPPIYNCIDIFRSVQEAGKCLLITADLTYGEIAALIDALDIRGLYLSITLDADAAADAAADAVGGASSGAGAVGAASSGATTGAVGSATATAVANADAGSFGLERLYDFICEKCAAKH
ncbi:MAG: hypothetical protein FWH01_03590 [Oscillospiraceae bacterium]|nr:hypothetical protein [Oscillospiraceae bacterium]